MGIYIKNMEMPKNCDVCPLIAEADDYYVCYINEQFIPWKWIDEHSAEQRHPKPSWCPLIEVPPHGRLIDADALLTLCKDYAMTPNDDKFCKHLEYALTKVPTIIEAEEEEHGRD